MCQLCHEMPGINGTKQPVLCLKCKGAVLLGVCT